MNMCGDDGMLRAALDGACSPVERAALDAHMKVCPDCRERMHVIYRDASRVAALLGTPVAPDTDAAFARFQASTTAANQRSTRSFRMNQPLMRRIASATAGVAVAATLFAFPPVRAAADSFLQMFRARNVVFVQFDPDRAEQLRDLNLNGRSLFLNEPTPLREPAEPQTVATTAEAAVLAGFPVTEPTLPADAGAVTSIRVTEAAAGEATVDVETARMALSALDITDVTIPDALGSAPIQIETSPVVMIDGTNFSIVQTLSPDVTLPEGVELAELGRAALRVAGMTPDQAAEMSRSIDWSSTLVVPLPTTLNNVQQIDVNGAKGLLMTRGDAGRGGTVYLQQGEKVIVVESRTLAPADLLSIAGSL